MTRQKRTSVIMVLIIFLAAPFSHGQTNRTIKRNVATVLFASLGGAILGLSTLSFYGEPQEHTDNITAGALLGFAAGMSYVIIESSKPEPSDYEYSNVFDKDKRNRRGSVMNLAKAPIQFAFDF
ncbi:MAG: hypothetical protein ACXVCP_00835 [Bdellovibrio sp.]